MVYISNRIVINYTLINNSMITIYEKTIGWLFNLSYICQHIGTIYQIYLIEKKQSIKCVSIDTQCLFLFGTIARSIWIFDTILQELFITYIEVISSFIIYLYFIVFVIIWRIDNMSTYRILFDPKKKIYERWQVIVLACAVLAYFFFPGNDGQYWDIQMLVSFNIFIDAGGLIPQIPLLYRYIHLGVVSELYLMSLATARMLRLIFWVILWINGQDFLFLIIADLIHLACVSSFVLTFIKNINKMLLPIHSPQRIS